MVNQNKGAQRLRAWAIGGGCAAGPAQSGCIRQAPTSAARPSYLGWVR